MNTNDGKKKLRGCGYFLLFILLIPLAAFLLRKPILNGIGDFLVVSDSLEKADAIAILGGHAVHRAEKASELFLQGWAPRIVIPREDYPYGPEELKRYGLASLEGHEIAVIVLKFLKVPESAIEVLENYNHNTVDEARSLMKHMTAKDMKHLIVVTSNFHSRRSRLLFRRLSRDTGIKVSIIAADPDFEYDPNEWWTRRMDSRTLLWEYQKVLFYALRYW